MESELNKPIQDDKKEKLSPSTSQSYMKTFTCYLCNLHSKYDYYGTRPLDRHLLNKPIDELTNDQKNQLNSKKKENIILMEKCFVSDDPFSELKSANFLVLGSRCSVCQQMVCPQIECSFFYYNKRFCLTCASIYIRDTSNDEFPLELKSELIKIINNNNNSKID